MRPINLGGVGKGLLRKTCGFTLLADSLSQFDQGPICISLYGGPRHGAKVVSHGICGHGIYDT